MGDQRPPEENALPITSSEHPEFPAKQKRLFQGVLKLLNREQVPYLVAGAFALQAHTGIWRNTKDLDLFLTAPDTERALELLAAAGFECEVTDPVWLAKAHQDDFYVDLITGMSNGAFTVDDRWLRRGAHATVIETPTRVLAAEELITSKLFVTRRERFDGADIAHVVYGTRGKLDWERLLSLAGEHWEILLWNLLLFRYCYPMHSDFVPGKIWEMLLERLQHELRTPDRKAPFRGSLIDCKMFAIDVNEWGFSDLEKELRNRREPKLEWPTPKATKPAA